MNIEESINKIKEVIYMSDGKKVDYIDINHSDFGGEVSVDVFINAIETLLTAYEEKCKELKKEIQDDLDVRNRWGLTLQELEKEKETSHYNQSQLDIANAKLIEEKEKNKKAIEFIKENSHEFHCKRDDLIELEFDDNTNASDLIDILDGNW